MNYAAIQAELALPAYDGLDDQAVADALNAVTVDTIRDVPTADARGLLLGTGEWGAIVLLARTTPSAEVPAQLVAAAITTQDTLSLTEVLEVTKPAYWEAIQALSAALVTAGAVSAETSAALLDLRNTKVSRASQLGLGVVAACDVQTARLV